MRKYKYPKDYRPDVYEHEVKLNVRYLLGNTGTKTMICFGINPSNACIEYSDPTMNKLVEVSLNNGYDSCVMANPYPLREEKPMNLPLNADFDILEKNITYIESLFHANTNGVAYAMWGDFVSKRDYIKESIIEIIKLSKKYSIKWKHFNRLSKSGNPYHFSYINRIKEPKELKYCSFDFDIDEYLLLISNQGIRTK